MFGWRWENVIEGEVFGVFFIIFDLSLNIVVCLIIEFIFIFFYSSKVGYI